MSANGAITTDISNHIGTIEFYHPKGNSLPGHMLRELAETIAEIGERPEVHVIVLQSRGDGAFCAGASFDELVAISDFEEGKDFFMGFAQVLNVMRQCPKLIIVRVHGKTVGGGVGVIAAGDYTIAHHSASIKLSELALGIGPFVVGPAVRRKVGIAAFSTLSINAASWNSAEWALDKGLFSAVCQTTEELDTEVTQLAETLAGYSPEAMRELKKVFWNDTEDWEDLLEQRAKISGRLVLSDFTKDFIHNFKNS